MPASVTVTDRQFHQLTTTTHEQGITHLKVAAEIEHYGQVLLIGGFDLDFTPHWELPTATVLPGQTLRDALSQMLDLTGHGLSDITGYLGHHDDYHDGDIVRTFGFAVTADDPTATCRHPAIAHRWAGLDDEPPPGLTPPTRQLLQPAWGPDLLPADVPAAGAAPLAAAVRACAAGIYPDEASIDLLIYHDVFLNRDDFTTRFIDQGAPSADGTELAAIDWHAAIDALNAGRLPCSGGEQRMLRLAASLARGIPVSLRDTLTGLDDRNLNLVISAVQHAAGRRPGAQSPYHFLVQRSDEHRAGQAPLTELTAMFGQVTRRFQDLVASLAA